MPAVAVALILVSSLLHSFWNLLLKKAQDKQAFLYLFLLATPILYLPMGFGLLLTISVPSKAVPYILGTAVSYAFYFAALARSYEHGELSFAYPLARGVGMMLTPVWAALLVRDERFSLGGVAGIVCLLIGSVVIQMPNEAGISFLASLRHPASKAALLTGLMTSVYSVIDRVGIRLLQESLYPPLYIYLTYTACTLLLTPQMLTKHGVRLAQVWRAEWKGIVAVAFLSLFTYLLVLFAMRVANVGYVVALRATSALFGVLLGTEVLGEGQLWKKLSATTLMVLGALLISLFG